MQDYVTNLHDIVRSCNYGTLQDQIVCDQFIEEILCDKTLEKLLLEPDELTLNQVVVIALQVEAALECSTLLADARPPVDVPTQQLRSSCHSGHCHKQHGGDPHLSVMTTLRLGMYQLARHLLYCAAGGGEPSTPDGHRSSGIVA